MANSMDLLRSHESTIARTAPKPIPFLVITLVTLCGVVSVIAPVCARTKLEANKKRRIKVVLDFIFFVSFRKETRHKHRLCLVIYSVTANVETPVCFSSKALGLVTITPYSPGSIAESLMTYELVPYFFPTKLT